MYKLYYERDVILPSGRVLRGDIYIVNDKQQFVNVYNTKTGKTFTCTQSRKIAKRYLEKLNKGEYIATRF